MRGFTLLELMAALGLSSLLIGVVALAVHHTSRAGRETTRKIDARRTLGEPVERMQEDASRALAVADLPAFFGATRVEAPLLNGGTVRTDAFELTLLAGDPPRLVRVCWSVSWDPAAERGWLCRETTPVGAGELPPALAWLASTAPPERELVLSNVAALELAVGDASGEVAPPLASEPPLAPGLVASGVGGPLRHVELGVPPGALEQVPPGSLVWLRDQRTSGAPAFEEGWFLLDRVEADRAILGERVSWAERVAYRAARLPRHLAVDLIAAGSRVRAVLPLASRREQGVFEEAARVAGEPPP